MNIHEAAKTAIDAKLNDLEQVLEKYCEICAGIYGEI